MNYKITTILDYYSDIFYKNVISVIPRLYREYSLKINVYSYLKMEINNATCPRRIFYI